MTTRVYSDHESPFFKRNGKKYRFDASDPASRSVAKILANRNAAPLTDEWVAAHTWEGLPGIRHRDGGNTLPILFAGELVVENVQRVLRKALEERNALTNHHDEQRNQDQQPDVSDTGGGASLESSDSPAQA